MPPAPGLAFIPMVGTLWSPLVLAETELTDRRTRSSLRDLVSHVFLLYENHVSTVVAQLLHHLRTSNDVDAA